MTRAKLLAIFRKYCCLLACFCMRNEFPNSDSSQFPEKKIKRSSRRSLVYIALLSQRDDIKKYLKYQKKVHATKFILDPITGPMKKTDDPL